MSRLIDARIVMACPVGPMRSHVHGVLDHHLGRLGARDLDPETGDPGSPGRPTVRLDVPLERLGAPGVVVAWASATGARVSVYGPVLWDIMEDAQPSPTAVDYQTSTPFVTHVRWPDAASQAAQSQAVGYVVTQRRDAETGEWTEAPDTDAILAQWGLARLSGTPEEQGAAVEAAVALEVETDEQGNDVQRTTR